ncbi:hypothetical protein G7054_g3530 [Neopestalotiopsis clavispora]|nr:hypothetical protein G7054_g3530 [Neopestalotiopsis clavispora]
MASITKLVVIFALTFMLSVSAVPQLVVPWNAISTISVPTEAAAPWDSGAFGVAPVATLAPRAPCLSCLHTAAKELAKDIADNHEVPEPEDEPPIPTVAAAAPWDGGAFGVPPVANTLDRRSPCLSCLPALLKGFGKGGAAANVVYHDVPEPRDEPTPTLRKPITVMVHGFPSVIGSSSGNNRDQDGDHYDDQREREHERLAQRVPTTMVRETLGVKSPYPTGVFPTAPLSPVSPQNDS